MTTLRQILQEMDQKPSTAWLYLPVSQEWDLDSQCAILESEEVPPDLEDDPEAGIPVFAKKNGLKQVLPVATVQDIVSNARAQRPRLDIGDLLTAFLFYYKNDAFIAF